MGTGEATGDKRAIQAAEAAINNPLLDDISMKGAHGVIINVTGGYDMTLFEADEACNRIRDEVDPNANIIFGATFDNTLEGVMRVSIVATGIEKESEERRRSGGNSVKTDAVGNKTLERARPNTDTQPAPITASQPSIPPQHSTPLFVPASQAVRNIQAPAPAPVVVAPQPLQTATVIAQDPEQDLFEQGVFAAAGQENTLAAQNTAMRGTRYGNSFIPPKPIEAQNPSPAYHGAPPVYVPAAATGAGTSSALQLNPPKLPTGGEKRRSPSLFERITGTVQQHLEGLREEQPQAAPRQRVAPSAGHSEMAPPRPSQGSLNIDAPARAKPDDELDIPAFLRRQAN